MTTRTSTTTDRYDRPVYLDAAGRRYVASEDGATFYITACCDASAKGSGNVPSGVCCRSCYAEIDPALGGIPPQAPLRQEVVAHRSTRRYAERYIAGFADAIGDTTQWDGSQHVPIHVEWDIVDCRSYQGTGFDIISTVWPRNPDSPQLAAGDGSAQLYYVQQSGVLERGTL